MSVRELKVDTTDFLTKSRIDGMDAWEIYLLVYSTLLTNSLPHGRFSTGSGIAEETTNDRAVATRRNVISFAVMNITMIPLVNVHLICNLDATQLAVGDSKGGHVEVKYCNDDGRPQSVKTVTKGGSIVAYFMKSFLLFFADGSTGRSEHVVADGSMYEWQRHRCIGYQHRAPPGVLSGFCETWCCNINLFHGVNKATMYKAISSKKEVFHLLPESMMWFLLEGEPVPTDLNVWT